MPPVPQSPEWWLRRLHKDLTARQPAVKLAGDYYDGKHNLAFESRRFLQAFGGMFEAFADNWCAVVVDAVEERLNVEGFRLPDATATSDVAHRIWQDNELDAQSQLAHTEAITCGEATATVWVGDGGAPEITVADATSSIVAHHPKFTRRRLAGLRLYQGDDARHHAELFLPDFVYLFRSDHHLADGEMIDSESVRWIADTTVPTAPDGWMENLLGVVPMVALPNRPRLRKPANLAARSEIADVIPIQNAINKLLADMLIASEFAAMPQRALLNMEQPADAETGQKTNPFTSEKKLWFIPPPEPGDPAVQPHQFSAADLSNYVNVVEMLKGHVASITRTPPHYLNPGADRLSGESIKAAETGLVAKCRRKQRHLGEAWEETMRLAGRIAGDTELGGATRMETVWADPESRTEAEHTDAVLKQKALGLPDEFLWERLDLTPTEIARAKAMKSSEALLGGLLDSSFDQQTPGAPGAIGG